MPAFHRRNVPNCKPMVDGGMRKCSAVEDFARRGACPPLGSGWGVAQSAVPIHCTKPQLRLFITWCAGASRDERLLRKWNTAASRVALCPARSSRRTSRRGSRALPGNPRPTIVIPAKAGIQRGGRGWQMTCKQFQQPDPHFHTLVRRRQPAWAIATKACPGLRSGMCPPINLDAGSPPAKRADL